MERIKAVFNWSGGKDSAHALLRAMQSGKYEIVALLTTVNRDTHRSTMHGIPTALLQAQADSIGIPLHIVDPPRKAIWRTTAPPCPVPWSISRRRA